MATSRARKQTQSARSARPDGAAIEGPQSLPAGQEGGFLTTAQGVRLPDTDHSLKAGPRGPSLMEDFHLREKITHFDHERIPERVVHARGAAAHGVFRAYGNASDVTKAGFLATEGLQTPVFVRFSTVLGSRGSADTVRDVRGFAVKFYTAEGNFGALADVKLTVLLQETFRHAKVLGAWGDGEQALRTAGLDTTAPGVLLADSMTARFAADLIKAVGLHRVWERAPLVMAAAAPTA